jgi:hypothetical protein
MALIGALVKKSVDQTAANYSAGAVIAWDAEVYDSDTFHDNVTANSRITIPVSYNGRYGIFTATVSMSAVGSTTTANVVLAKNSGFAYIGFAGTTRLVGGHGTSATAAWVQIRSGPVLLATADIFEARLFSSDSSITVESESSFGLEVLPLIVPTQPKVLAKLSADITAADYSTPTAIPWNGVDEYDTNAIHNPASNNTTLIIPAALNGKYVVVGAQVYATSVTGAVQNSLAIRKGGSLVYDGFGGSSRAVEGSYGQSWLQAFTQPIQVTTGDEFEALYWNAETSITIESEVSWFGLRVVG